MPNYDPDGLGWMGYTSDYGEALIRLGRCSWGGGAPNDPFCEDALQNESPFCPPHTERYIADLGVFPSMPSAP